MKISRLKPRRVWTLKNSAWFKTADFGKKQQKFSQRMMAYQHYQTQMNFGSREGALKPLETQKLSQ